ncbi:MAG: iron ABC transporter substrate-binding protein [Desulfurivibrionaceae bacterium]|jgi:iron complex transport system substrate-binding protein
MAGRLIFPRIMALLILAILGAAIVPATAAGARMIQITDMAGRKVSIPARVKRIVPLGGAMRFVVYMQGLDAVVGVEAIEQKKSPDSAGRPYSLAVADRAARLPAIGEGGPGRLPDFERIMAVAPEVILAVGVDTSQVATIQQKTGIPVVVLHPGATTALDLNQISDSFRLLGRVIQREERAAELIAYLDGCESDLRTRVEKVRERPPVYLGAIGYKGRHGITSTESAYAPLAWLNGRNVADALPRPGHAFIDLEQLLRWDPEVIFLDAGGLSLVADEYRRNPGLYRGLKALRSGRVFVVPPYNSYHTNLETALANAYFMGKILWPGRFADVDPAVKADDILRFFTGVAGYGRLKEALHGFGRAEFGDNGVAVR